jgi:4-hydroxy-tetrahydrodipicolinate synthase
VLKGDSKYSLHFNTSDELTKSQTKYAEEQLQLFDNWWSSWEGKDYKP